jgi:two-component sensor histidine kinase
VPDGPSRLSVSSPCLDTEEFRSRTSSAVARKAPAGFDIKLAKSLGLKIVQTLTEQLAGHFEMVAGKGTTCRIVIPAHAVAPS